MAAVELYWQNADGQVRLYRSDARNLSAIPDESIDMIATSPPYWRKRWYGEETVAVWGGEAGCQHQFLLRDKTLHAGRGDAQKGGKYSEQEPIPDTGFQDAYCSLCRAWRGQLGLEPTWQEYIAHLCECAKEWWRALKPTGNLFINIGDTFAGSHCGEHDRRRRWSISQPELYDKPSPQAYASIPKMKLGIPWRLRFALNDMGWVSRADLVWYKGKEYPDGTISKVAMPESARREACCYEMVFRFTKTHKMNYYVHEKTGECRSRPPSKRVEGVDFEWVTHEACEGKGCDMARCHDGMVKSTFWHGYSEWLDLDAVRTGYAQSSLDRVAWEKQRQSRPSGKSETRQGGLKANEPKLSGAGANPGDVLVIQPEPFALKHYAIWPSELCRRMILVGCPKEVCPKCGEPRERLIGREKHPDRNVEKQRRESAERTGRTDGFTEGPSGMLDKTYTIGWSDCGCNEGFVPGVILDPFFGASYRLAKEALKLGRNVIGVEMKEEYLEMAKGVALYGERGFAEELGRREEGIRQEVLL